MGNTDWHKINLKLYPVLLEKSLKELGLPDNSYSLLGNGSNGQAYLSNGRVYKITTDKSEAIESDKLIGKNNSRIANIFDVKRIITTLTNVEVFLIVLEHLNTKRQPIFEEIQTELIRLFEEELNIHPFDVIYFYRFNPTIYKNEYEQDVYRLLDSHQREKYYYNSLLQIIDELKANNIQSLDVQYHNLGIKSNGNLAYYDIGSGDIYGNVRGSVYIDEDSIVERVMTYMKNSSAVKVKKNCQLAGKGNTSDACNQGDIKNLELTKMNEHTGKWNQKYKDKIGSLVEFELEGMIEGINEGIHAYHGTPNKFDQFSIDKIGSSDGREVGGWGIYFTDDVGIANDYRTGDGTVMEVELRNGKYLNFDEGLDDDIANDIVNRGLRKGLSEQDIEQFQSDFMDEQYRYDITNKQVYEWLSAVLGDNKAASTYLSSAGYIGNKFTDKTNPNATNYVIFDPNNIKIVSNGEELDEDDQVQQTNEFDLKMFDSLRSFAARKKYADSKLQKIGAGSSRIVYLMPDGKNVLKLASNVKGLAQNNSECGLGQDNYFGSILAKVSDCHNDDQWIVSELAKKVSPSRFTQLTGVDIKNLGMYLRNFQEENRGRNGRAIFSIDPTVKEQMNENPFVQQLTEMMQSYDLEAGDLGRLASYGEVNREGQADIVVSDYGLTKDVYKTHYDKSGKRNMYENYFDMNEEVKVEINDLPFKADVEQAGGKIYSVGGAVRDKLLGKESKDLDLLITGIPLDQLEEILKKYGRVDNVGKSFGIIKFNTPQTGELDIAIPRTERKNDAGGYQGFDVTSDHTLPIEKDLERRDFTINAIAKDSSGLMIDPYGGQGDIEKKQIKMVNPQAFSDDPLRMLRAVQFAARFNFEIEPETMKAIQQNASKIKEISPERILIEFDKIVKKGNPTVGAKLLRQTGLYNYIFGTNKGINIAGFDKVKTMGEFIYKLISGNVASPSEFYKNNMKGDLESYNEIKALEIGGEFRQDELGNPYKRIFDMYKVYPKSISTGIFGDIVPRLASEMKSKNIPFSLKEVPVNGNDLMELGYAGKQIGEVFVHILNKIYTEQLPNEREAILNYLKSSK